MYSSRGHLFATRGAVSTPPLITNYDVQLPHDRGADAQQPRICCLRQRGNTGVIVLKGTELFTESKSRSETDALNLERIDEHDMMRGCSHIVPAHSINDT